MNSHVLPPTLVPSTQSGRSPQYSATSTGGSEPVPHDPNPSMSSLVNPASAMARDAACWCSWNGDLSSTRPQSDSAAPTMATRFFAGTSAHLEAAGAAVEDAGIHLHADLGGIPAARPLRRRDLGAERPRHVVGDGVADGAEHLAGHVHGLVR